MLDSALQTKKHKNTDWAFVQKEIHEKSSSALFWLSLFALFLAPFHFFSTTFSALSVRTLFFSFCVFFAWIILFLRDLFGGEGFYFQVNKIVKYFISLLILVFVLYFLNKGVFVQDASNPTGVFAWISVSLFCVLIFQIKNLKSIFLARVFVGGLIVFSLVSVLFSFGGGIDKISRDAKSLFSFSSGVSVSRFFKKSFPDYFLFGYGIGSGKRAFWNTAEQADLDSLKGSLPAIGGAYSQILWDGGILLFIVFVICVWVPGVSILLRSRKILPKTPLRSKERISAKRLIWLSSAFLVWLVFLWFKTFSFLVLLITFVMVCLLEKYFVEIFGKTSQSQDEARLIFKHDSFILKILRISVFVVFCFLVYLGSLFVFPSGTAFGPAVLVAKAEIITKDIEKNREIFMLEPSKSEQFFNELKKSAESVDFKNLSPELSWSLGRSLASAGKVYSLVFEGKADFSEWFDLSAKFYDAALLGMPDNIILLVESANFHRTFLSDEKAMAKAISMLDRAIKINPEYIPARMEKASIYIIQQKNDKALEEIEPFVKTSDEMAYSAGSLCAQLNKFEKAVEYYTIAISKNEKHLQARFELVQSLVALARTEDALKELGELENFVAKDDVETLSLITQLKEMIQK